MSDKYGTVLLFYTGIVMLVLLMASGIERYNNRVLSAANQKMENQTGENVNPDHNMDNRIGRMTGGDQSIENENVQIAGGNPNTENQTEKATGDSQNAENQAGKGISSSQSTENQTGKSISGSQNTENQTGKASGNQNIDTQLDVHTPRIALTFDDGPSYYTKELLEGLKEREVCASFFLLGKNIEGREETVKRMYEDGHLIGNHTYDHVKLTALSTDDACKQVDKTRKLIYKITGYNTLYVRPPYGLWPKEMEYCVTMIPVLWDVDPEDWTSGDVDGIVKKVVSSARDGGIILMHDNYDTSVEAALEIVDQLKKQGYEFVTVDDLVYD